MSGRQAGTLVGQVIGSYFGPIGAAIGGAIGGFVGGEIDGPQKGPRLDDTSSPALEFGAKIPRAYGRVWCTLSPLWWSKLRESTANSGGKGAADQTTDNYVYHADMLGRLCEFDLTRWPNPVWTRIRIDGKIVATRLAASSVESLQTSAETELWNDAELFDGNATQTPWSVMEAAEGVGNVSAYRDQGTFGFTNLLWQNGRAPSLIEVEVSTDSTPAEVAVDHGTIVGTSSSYGYALTMPGGIQAGDSLVAYILHRNTAATPVFTDGWDDAVIGHSQESSSSTRLHFFTRTATGDINDDLADFTVAADGGTGALWVVIAFRGEVDVLWPGSFGGGSGGGDYNPNTEAEPGQSSPINPGQVTKVAGFQIIMTAGFLVSELGGAGLSSPPAGYTLAGLVQETVVFGGDPTEFNVQLGVAYSQYNGTVGNPPPWDAGNASFGSGGYGTLSFAITWATVLPTFDPQPVDLQDVLESEMLRCTPLTTAHIDMSAAAGKEVWGFKASRSAAAECGVLLDWYYLDIFCLDKIYVVERGGAVEQTIPYAYTGSAIDGTSDPFSGLTRGADVESQFATSVQYINILADGEVDTQQGQRVGTGSEVRAVNFSIYSKATLAKGRADTITHDTRVAAHTATVRLGTKQAAKMQPASVQTFVDNKGISYRTRVLRLVWNRGVYDVDVCLDDPNILKTVGITTEVDTSVIEVTPPGETELILLDIPILRDVDNDPGYYQVVSGTGDWHGARVFESVDGLTYTSLGDITQSATTGVTTTVLGDWPQAWLIDHKSSVTVEVNETLSSYTHEAVLAGTVPPYLIGDEIVYAMTATLVSAGVYTLSNFIRACLGTEAFTDTHAIGDVFVVLQNVGIKRGEREAGELDIEYQFKGVSLGSSIDSVDAIPFTDTGVGLKPYAPVDVKATRQSNGDIEITWNRRTRLSTPAAWTTVSPLGEVTEAYVCQLMSSDFSAFVRGIDATSPRCLYTLADQETDWGSARTTLYVRVRQVSAIVGNGYATDSTVPVGEVTYFSPLSSASYPDVRLWNDDYALITRNAASSMGLYRYADGATTLELIATTSADNNFRYLQSYHLRAVDPATGDWVMYLRAYTNPASLRKLMYGNLATGSALTVVPSFMTASPPFALGFNAGVFIALCVDGNTYSSSDSGATWSNDGAFSGVTPPSASSFDVSHMRVIGSRLVLCYGDLFFCTAGDGLVWDAATGDVASAPATYTTNFAVTSIDTLGTVGCALAVGEISGAFTALIYTSTDGQAWTERASGTALGSPPFANMIGQGARIGVVAFNDAFYVFGPTAPPDIGFTQRGTLGTFDGKLVYFAYQASNSAATSSRLLLWSPVIGDPIVASSDGDAFTETIAWP